MWSIKNKVCVVTGATSGLGFETAKKLQSESAQLVLIVRNQDRKNQLQQTFPGAKYYFSDFSNSKEVYEVALKIKNDYPVIHLLKNNAGVISFDRLTMTKENIESTISINFLSHYILTETLIPCLDHAENSRIVFTGSLMHRQAILNFDDLYHEENYSPMKMYSTTKLMLVMYSHFLGEKLNSTGIHTHCVDPGAVATQISRSRGKFFNFMFSFGKFFLTNVKKGSRTNVYACVSEEISDKTSTYLIKENIGKADEKALNSSDWKRLEQWSLEHLKRLGISL